MAHIDWTLHDKDLLVDAHTLVIIARKADLTDGWPFAALPEAIRQTAVRLAADAKPAPARKGASKQPKKPAIEAPAVVAELDYDSLTLAQLRARIQSLSVADLRALLAYEEAAKARAPFQTLLANRITRATAK